VLVDTHCSAADDGTDSHRLQASWPEGDAPKELLAELSEDARIGYFTAAKMWREEIGEWMPDSQAEVALMSLGESDADDLSGHVDRISVRPDKRTAAAIDWKFGRKTNSYKHQGFGYAFLILRTYPVDSVTIHFGWVRTQELESYTVTRERAEQWNRERIDRIERWDGKFCTGEHCAHCPRLSTCPAQRQLVRRDVETLTTVGIPDVTAMAPAQLVEFHERLGVLEAVLTSAQKSVRMEVEKRGEVLSGDGQRVLHLVEENVRRTVDTLKAWPVLNRELEAEELAECLTVSISDVEKIVAKKAGRGNGVKAKAELARELEALGAVEQGKVLKLKLDRTEGNK
jgi:hypothetical protein